MPTVRLKPAVLLDRDGVINLDREDYVRSWDQFRFIPGSLAALARIRQARLEVYIITNQAGIARGLFSTADLLDMHLRMRLEVRAAGGLIHGICFCPHDREDGCLCRKPNPGMLQLAAVKYGVDLPRSVFAGDACRDVLAGQQAGCRTVLVGTNACPQREREKVSALDRPPDHEAEDLASATDYLLDCVGRPPAPGP